MLDFIKLLWVKGKKRQRILAKLSYDGNELEDKMLEIEYDGDELLRKKLELSKKRNKISDLEYEKELATLNKKPWFKIKDVIFKDNNPAVGTLDIEWNTFFIQFLTDNGYTGETEEDIVNKWISELAATIIQEEIFDRMS